MRFLASLEMTTHTIGGGGILRRLCRRKIPLVPNNATSFRMKRSEMRNLGLSKAGSACNNKRTEAQPQLNTGRSEMRNLTNKHLLTKNYL